MSRTKCKEDSYLKDGVCCKRCDAGTYKKKDCDATTETQCAKCEQGRYMATVNYLDQCRYCKTCNSQHNLRTLRECTAREDAACECVDGFYCSDSRCDHCRRVTSCPEGHGVEAPASMTNDTVCAPCDSGFFSDVSDHFSRCKPHTRCDAIGRDLKTPGTATTDAVCGGFKTQPCSWALPAGLWVGLVLTSALVFAVALFCWRRKRFGRHRGESHTERGSRSRGGARTGAEGALASSKMVNAPPDLPEKNVLPHFYTSQDANRGESRMNLTIVTSDRRDQKDRARGKV
uniref:TNFR-Cys domain-containing protein n=1 Tax=Periophthalmus magnuspinnatus TaxID=409849 RepID=A0A3B3ZL37_9GOBI